MPAFVVKDGDCALFIYAGNALEVVTLEQTFIKLGAKRYDLGKGYSAVKHPPHVPNCQYHLHVYDHNETLFSLNQDGTAHDKSHGERIPNFVKEQLGLRYPDFTLPPNGRIASTLPTDEVFTAYKTELEQSGVISTDYLLEIDLDNVDF